MTEKENDSFFERKLKKFSIKEIEGALSKAITELVGNEYEVDIKSIDYEQKNSGAIGDKHEVYLSIQKKQDDSSVPF
jgi:hypothetical protein